MKIELSHTEPANDAKPGWMVVDDNPDLLAVGEFLLREIGDAEVVAFDSPAKALDAFATAPDAFELVVSDFEMPGMNGVELCRQLRKISSGLKIVLATGSADFTEAEAALRGFSAMVRKPFQIEALERALERAGVREKTRISLAA